jgi:thioesterase domain-containing protein/acyl carrier protein
MTKFHRTVLNGHGSQASFLEEVRFLAPKWYPQQPEWARNPRSNDNAAYNYVLPLRIRGPLHKEALRLSLEEIVRRHQVLRSVFRLEDGKLFQLVMPLQSFRVSEENLDSLATEERVWKAQQLAVEDAQRPFDLTRDLLLRATLVRLASDEHVLLLTTHHIACDDWSTGILLREFSQLYEAFDAGKPSPLPPLKFQYSDFVRDFERRMQGGERKSRLQFWKEQLANASDFHHLAPDLVRPPKQTFHGTHEVALYSEELLAKIKALSQREHISIFMTLLAAFQCLLQRYSGHNDIGIASCVANRNSEVVEGIVGPFSNRLVLRTNMQGNPTFRELLGRVRDVALNAYSQQDLPFGEIVEERGHSPKPDRNALFQVLMILQNAPKARWEVPGLSFSWLPLDTGTTRYDLNVWLQFKEGLEVDLQYNTDLFMRSTMRRVLEDYQAVLTAMVQNPESKSSDVIVEAERPKIEEPLREQNSVPSSASKDSIELRMVQIWENLLHIHPIKPDQNYFELGGDSLRAVQLFGQIEKEFNVKLSIATLFRAQTISELCNLIREHGAEKDWSSLVAIQPRGSRPPLYLVHGAGGNVFIYRSLALSLGSHQPVYGLQSQGLDGRRPFATRIQDMAALYVQEIRKVQPQGPYFLGGYCMGGTVALEMAQKLRAQGEEVAFLALIDTSNWSNVSVGSFLDGVRFHWQKVDFHLRNFLLLNSKDKLSFLRGKLGVLRSRTSVWFGMLQSTIVKKNQAVRNSSLVLAQLWELNERAAFEYIPTVYPGRITQFRPVRQYSRYDGPERSWTGLASEGVDLIDLQAYPGGMLVEPFVADLAARINSCVEGLISRPPARAD